MIFQKDRFDCWVRRSSGGARPRSGPIHAASSRATLKPFTQRPDPVNLDEKEAAVLNQGESVLRQSEQNESGRESPFSLFPLPPP